VPLPKAGAHFHVLQSHGNRYKMDPYFCLRQKYDTHIEKNNGLYHEIKELVLTPGMKLFLNDQQVTQHKGFGRFNVACKWK